MIAEFSIMPVGKGESLSKEIAEALKLVEKSGLLYVFGPMGTSVEGEWDEVMNLIKKCRDKMLENCNRVSLTIKIDERKGATDQLTHKVKSVEEKLGKNLRK